MEYNDRKKKRMSCERPGVAEWPNKRGKKKAGSERRRVRFMRSKKSRTFQRRGR